MSHDNRLREAQDPRNRPEITCRAYLVGHDRSEHIFAVLARTPEEAAFAYVAGVVHGGLEQWVPRNALDLQKGLRKVWVKARDQSQSNVLTDISSDGLRQWLEEDPIGRPTLLQAAVESMVYVPPAY